MEAIKRAAGYIRVSTVEQSLKGLSIETQIAEIKAYAKAHNMKLEDIYIDRGITARKSLEKRLDFMRMMKDVESGRINHIIVLRLDRFFRNVYDYHKMMNEYLDPNKCDWSAVKEQYTTTTTNGRLMINLRLAIAEQECDTDSDRIKDVLAHRVSQGFAISHSVPYGYKVENKRVVIDEEKVPLVKDMFDTFELNSSIRKTHLYINDKYGTKFVYKNFARCFKNRKYIGEYRDNKNYCEPIITKEQFDRVQRLIKVNVRPQENKHTYIFSRLIKCDKCGKTLSGNRITKPYGVYSYYRCNYAASEKKCENNILITQELVERFLLDNIEQYAKKYLMPLENVGKSEKKPIKSNRKVIENKLQRLNDLYVNGFIDMAKYKADYDELQSQIIDIPEEEKDTKALQEFLKSDYKEIYPTLTDVEKQALWRSIIKEIRVSGKDVKDIIFL